MLCDDFIYTFRVAFHDTDAMGVMHHAAFLHTFEQARVAWLRDRDLSRWHHPHYNLILAVTSVDCQYLKSAVFDQQLKVRLQVIRQGIRLVIRYAIQDTEDNLLATGNTKHVPMNSALKVVKYPPQFLKKLEKEKWTETWP